MNTNGTRKRGILGLLVIFVAFNLISLVVVVGLGIHSVDRLAVEEQQDIQLALNRIETAYELETAFEQSLVALEAYAQTRDRSLLRNWDDGHARFQRGARELQSLVDSQPESRTLQTLATQESVWYLTGQRLIASGRITAFERWLSDSRETEESAFSQTLAHTIRTQRQSVQRLLGQVENLRTLILWQFITGMVLLVPTAALLAAIVRSRIWLPLRELTTTTTKFAAGNWQARTQLRHDDEFGQLGSTLNTMADTIAHTLRALRDSNRELQKLDRARDDFLSMVTHELKTPLTAITGNVQLLTRGRHGALNDAQFHAIDCIQRNASRLLHLVEELLDSTAIRQGQLDVTPILTDYAQLVHDAITPLQALADSKNIQVHFNRSLIPSCQMDPQRITQVLNNLLSNALNATPEHGDVTVRIDTTPEGLLTTVADTGPGIPPEHKDDIFTAFFKLGAKPGSTGLGLSISKALVEAHNGTIGVHSTPGSGATFWFTLPIQDDTTASTHTDWTSEPENHASGDQTLPTFAPEA